MKPRFRPTVRRAGRSALALVAPLAAAALLVACEAPPGGGAAAGAGEERTLAPGESHAWRIAPSPAGTPALLVVEQRGVDVEVAVTPGRGEGFVVDGPFDRAGREIVLLAGAPRYRVTVRGRETGAPPGRYRLDAVALAAAGRAGTHRLAAGRAATAAGRLYAAGTADAWRAAIGEQRRAFAAWQSAGDGGAAAEALYAEAVLHRLIDAPREGLAAARRALPLLARAGHPLEPYAWNEIGLDEWQLGELGAARRAFESAAVAAGAAGDAFLVGAAESNLCLLHLAGGALEAARDCYRAALPAIERARAAQIEGAARTNLGRIAEHLGEPDEAVEHHRRALAVATAAGDRRGQAQTLNNLGVLLRGLGDLDGAMASYAEALAIFEELGERRWQARVTGNLGAADQALGELGRAAGRFARARALFAEVEDGRGEAAALDNLGLVERARGAPAAALALHRRALALRREGGDRRGEAVTLRRLGEAHADLGDRPAALARLAEAVALAAAAGDRAAEAAARRGLGEERLAAGDVAAARSELDAALELAAAARQPAIEAEVLVRLAAAERAAGDGAAARRRAAAALGRLEGVRSRIDSPHLRASFSSLLRQAYAVAVDLAMDRHRADPAAGHHREALEIAERSRARALLDLLEEARVDLVAGVDPELLARRRALTRRLDAKSERLADPALDAARRERLEGERLALLDRLAVLDAEVRRASPAYAELVRPQPLAAAGIQALADADTVLAVYFLGEPRSTLWRVTAAAIDAFELPGRAAVETAARRVNERWGRLDGAGRAADHAAAAELAAMLRLPELAGARRLAVIADGALHLVPFAALPLAGEGGGPPVPLIARAEVVTLPSAAVLALDRRLPRRRGDRGSVAILADPAFGPGLAPLPGTRAEAAAIAAQAPGPSLVALGADAHRELVTGGGLGGYGVVHFATHAVVDATHPALSRLALSQVDAAGRRRPGFLHLHDVFNLRLDADLVVLSGCRTALGPAVRGEGPISLARGFMHAGSQRVMASLWPVDDRATAALMGRFYAALWRDRLPPAAALAAAQREMAADRRFRDPYHWAAFALAGDWR